MKHYTEERMHRNADSVHSGINKLVNVLLIEPALPEVFDTSTSMRRRLTMELPVALEFFVDSIRVGLSKGTEV